MTVHERVKSLLAYMSEGIFEKEDILSMTFLSAIAGENIFLLGPPGTAKSMIARKLKMIFSNATSFEYLMSRFSTPDELFGPVSISKLKNEDKYERMVEGYLPTADVVFLDEIWKAGPSIQNALLTAINEHIFQNGTETIQMKMKALIAASNELPNEDEGLEALWDRFLIREISNCIGLKENFVKLIKDENAVEPQIPSEVLITNDLYHQWQGSIQKVKIPSAIIDQVCIVRDKLVEKNGTGMDYYVSDRRWKKIFHLMQASAFLNGRKSIDISDLTILFHTLWNKTETITDVTEIVSQSFTHNLEQRLEASNNSVDKVIKKIVDDQSKSGNAQIVEDEYVVVNHFYYVLENYPNGTCLFAKSDYNRVLMDINTNSMLYYDKKKESWLIHAFYSDLPNLFNTGGSKMIPINIRKCLGGLIVNDVPYPFKKRPSQTENVTVSSDSPINMADEALAKLRNSLDEARKVISESDNLFMSVNDRQLLLRLYGEFERKLDRQAAKNENTRKIYERR